MYPGSQVCMSLKLAPPKATRWLPCYHASYVSLWHRRDANSLQNWGGVSQKWCRVFHYILVARTRSFVHPQFMEWSSQSAHAGHFVGESKEMVVKLLRFCICYCNITKPVLIQWTKPEVNIFILLLNAVNPFPTGMHHAPSFPL